MRKLNIGSAKLMQWLKQEQRVLLIAIGTAGLIVLVRGLGLLESWELSAFDRLFLLKPNATVEQREIIVTIGETEIRQAGKWPIPDREIAKLLEMLNAARPRAIGLGIYRDLPVEPGHDTLQKLYQNLPNLVGIEKLEDRNSPAVPAPRSLAASQRVGFSNALLDPDGRVRRGLLYWHLQGQTHTSFALKLALLYLKADGIVPQRAALNPRYLQLGQAVFRPLQKNDGGYVRIDAQGYQFMGHFIPPSAIEKVAMNDVLAGKIAPERFRDRIVLIGSTAPSLKDFAYIPYSAQFMDYTKPIYGVELHANFIAQLLDAATGKNSLIQVLPDWLEGMWILLWSAIGAWIVWTIRSPIRSSLMLLSAIVALFAAVYGNFLLGWWLSWIPPLLALIGSSAILTHYLAYRQEEFRRSKDFFKSAIDAIADPIFIKDVRHRWVVLNQAFCQLSGYSLEQLLGKSESDILSPEEAEILRAQDCLVFETGCSMENEEYFTDAMGKTYRIATKRSLHRDAAGNLFLIGAIRDITERKRVEDELRRTTVELSRSNEQLKLSRDRFHNLAYHDSLTGLPNRKHFNESLAQSLTWAKSNNCSIALLYLDLDGFKAVNDTLGHDFGDLLLEAVAGRIAHCVRNSDFVARLGGDEFTVILRGLHKVEDVSVAIGKITRSLSQPFALNGHTVVVKASIGSSIYPRDGDTEAVLLRKADLTMFEAKRLASDRISQNS
ncbi:CHASE2 domain-containing protein [Oscillatoria sp. FACHB-1406]|uniref:CHASE2 domain-containing protein n=1 Tax=Oscillatoria sp. FACHB-1406 TaxID=2692846 RepID=UPI001689F80A|nr:CHASE2 domain-containing protein [Oscillatoria sp. FACHB-1406]MBD2580573.1 CHASE2 domain-containing protein [Oscillatoria sp. FACHB-1406]